MMKTILLLGCLGIIILKPCQSFTIQSSCKQSPLLASSKTSLLLSSSAVYDGSEWRSIQDFLQREDIISKDISTDCGRMDVIVGTTENKRVVGIRANDDNNGNLVALDNDSIYYDSMAEVPNGVSDQDAISTLIASLPSIHCSIPNINGVGGDRSSMMVSGKVVIVGGNDYACFAAEGLASLGSSVSLVTNNSPKIRNKKNVNILPPAVDDNDDDEEQGFSSAIGQFDALLDTIGDERPKQNSKVLYKREDTNSIISLLRNQHNCKRYVSTITEAQSIVLNSGVLFGPGKADKYVKQVQQQSRSSSKQFQDVIPPKYFGSTVQTLLENGIIYRGYKNMDSTILRGWSLSEFWERSTWPVEAGSGNRFGFPVKEVGLSEEEKFALLKEKIARSILKEEEEGDDGEQDEEAQSGKQGKQQQRQRLEKDPYVKSVYGVEGLLNNVVYPEGDCVVFLSAQWCRTCKKLSPAYSKMARESMASRSSNDNDVFFVKADTTGILGKQLGKYLEVEAVPAFLFFKKGKRYGKVLSLSKLPSPQLDTALGLLESGKDWDADAILQADK